MERTYGSIGWAQSSDGRYAQFMLDLEPQVAIKAKRMFPRANPTRSNAIIMHDTPEIAADIVWLTQRYPLDMTDETRLRLHSRHDEFVEKRREIDEILTGGSRDNWPDRDLGVTPRPYQLTAAELMRTTGGMLLADEIGLGKTLSALLLLRDPACLPAVIVLPTHLPPQWNRRMAEYMPWLKGHVITKGSPVIRTKTGTKPYPLPDDTDVVFISYSKIAGWQHHLRDRVKTVIFDEVQELRKFGSDKYDAAVSIASQCDWRVGLSATPIYNYGDEAHTIFNVLSPGALGTRFEFLREWSGKETVGSNVQIKQTGALHSYLVDQGLLLRRTRDEVGRELEQPIVDTITVPSDTAAIEAILGNAAGLADRLLNSEDKVDRFVASGQFEMWMRQATGIDKAPYVAEFVRMLLDSERKVVLYGWHRDVYDIWLKALADFRPVMYTGSESPKQKDLAVQRFVEDPNCRVFICSLRSGAGLDDLQKVCNVAAFGELDWSPAMHFQGIGRLAREGQENSVLAFYLVSEEGSDPHMSSVLEIKRQQAEGITAGDDGVLFTTVADKSDRVKEMARGVLKRASELATKVAV